MAVDDLDAPRREPSSVDLGNEEAVVDLNFDEEEAPPDYRQAVAARPGVDFTDVDPNPGKPPVFLPQDDNTPSAPASLAPAEAARPDVLPFPPGITPTPVAASAPIAAAPTPAPAPAPAPVPTVVTATGEAVGGEHKDLPTIADLLAPATSSKPESTDFSEIVRPPFTGVPAVSAPPPQKFNVINVTALLIALAALVLVLLFPARAQVPAHSISGTQIKLGSITNNDLASGNISTGPAGANGAPGPRGPSGPTGAAGATGAASGLERVTYVSQNVANVSGTQSATANCSSSLKVIGGGATISGDGVVLTTSTVASNGWSATATPLPSSTNNTSIKYTLTVTAVCAQVKTSG